MSRNLLNRSLEMIGVSQKLWAKQETGGYGDAATSGLPVAGDAIEHIEYTPKFDIPREDSAGRSGRSLAVRLSGKKSVEWSFNSYIIPGTPDTNGYPVLPPIHSFLVSAFGRCDESDPTKKVYRLSNLTDKSLIVLEEATHFSRVVKGMVSESITFSLPGDGKAQFKAEGFAQDVYVAGQSELAQAVTGAAQIASKIIQDLTISADASGQSGNNISVAYTTGGTAGSEVVTVVGNAISVQIEDGVSTATQVKAAIDGFPASAALVSVVISGVGGNAQVAVASQYLSGGLGAMDIKVSDGEGERFEVGGYIDIVNETDGNTILVSARQIVAIGTGQNADILTLGGAALGAIAAGRIVFGHAPTSHNPISSEGALLGLKGSVSFAGFPALTCEVISAEIGLVNNFTKKDFLFGTSKSCGFIPDKRRAVSLKLEILITRENFNLYMRAKKFTAEDVTITLEPQDIPAPSFSSSAGRKWTFRMPKVEFNVPSLEQPGDKYVSLPLEGVAMATDLDNLDTELTLTLE